MVVRALGPSLASFGVSGPLSDPMLTIYDSNGSAIATNDNWQDDINCDRRPEEWTRAAKCARIGTRASPARRSIYRGRARSQRRYRQCLSRGLPSPLVPSNLQKSSSSDISGHDKPLNPVWAGAEVDRHTGFKFRENWCLTRLRARPDKQGSRSRLATFQRTFGQTEVVVCGDDRRWSGASRDRKQLEPGLSQMNEKSLLGIAFLRMIFGFARTGGQFTPSTGQLPTK